MLDTNILLRLSQPHHSHHAATFSALNNAAHASADLCISSQSVYEFLAVATRPISASGLGIDQASANTEIGKLTATLSVLYDSEEVVDQLRKMVVGYKIIGKSVHDARIVATMFVNKISTLMTINVTDFNRYKQITLIDPRVSFS